MLRPTEVVTGKNTRFSYLNANEPKPTQDGTRLRYSVSIHSTARVETISRTIRKPM